MTRVRIEDLPPKLREQVLAKAESPAPSSKRSRAVARGGSGTPYRCHTCGATFERYGAAAERCADSHGGARLEAILEPCPTTPKPNGSS